MGSTSARCVPTPVAEGVALAYRSLCSAHGHSRPAALLKEQRRASTYRAGPETRTGSARSMAHAQEHERSWAHPSIPCMEVHLRGRQQVRHRGVRHVYCQPPAPRAACAARRLLQRPPPPLSLPPPAACSVRHLASSLLPVALPAAGSSSSALRISPSSPCSAPPAASNTFSKEGGGCARRASGPAAKAYGPHELYMSRHVIRHTIAHQQGAAGRQAGRQARSGGALSAWWR